MEIHDAYKQKSLPEQITKIEEVVEKFKDSPQLPNVHQEFEKKTSLLRQWMGAFEERQELESMKTSKISYK